MLSRITISYLIELELASLLEYIVTRIPIYANINLDATLTECFQLLFFIIIPLNQGTRIRDSYVGISSTKCCNPWKVLRCHVHQEIHGTEITSPTLQSSIPTNSIRVQKCTNRADLIPYSTRGPLKK
jgi:hypothetical protein